MSIVRMAAAAFLLAALPAASQPPDGAGDEAAAQQPAPDPQAESTDAQSADVDSVRVDQSGPVDGVPAWVFGIWCIDPSARPQAGWGISRDHTAGVRTDGRTSEGSWTVVEAGADFATIHVDLNSGGGVDLRFRRRNAGDAGQDIMYAPGRWFDHCGMINFNERF